MNSDSYVNLGKTEIKISQLGLGTMGWGDVNSSDGHTFQIAPEIHAIYQSSLELGINFFDTAEMYGSGRSERHLGMNINGDRKKVIIATKFMPFPWRLSKRELRSALINSLKRLDLSQIDLYQMHWPFPPVPIKTWMEAMSAAFEDGLIRAVGVSNYSIHQVSIAQDVLARHSIPLASNQIKYSLLHRQPETSGLVEYCQKSGVTVIAYSPLEKGILTGKYTPSNLPPGFRAWRYNRSFLEKIIPLMDVLHEIGMDHNGKTPGQVSLNWLMVKGAVPIPGSRNLTQAKENAGAMGWKLTSEEVARLDSISERILH